jgi:hypothetical protein
MTCSARCRQRRHRRRSGGAYADLRPLTDADFEGLRVPEAELVRLAGEAAAAMQLLPPGMTGHGADDE